MSRRYRNYKRGNGVSSLSVFGRPNWIDRYSFVNREYKSTGFRKLSVNTKKYPGIKKMTENYDKKKTARTNKHLSEYRALKLQIAKQRSRG